VLPSALRLRKLCNARKDYRGLEIHGCGADKVPAAAVIPAPMAYIKGVVVKRLVVEPWASIKTYALWEVVRVL
jgi:hypothetical protein